MPVLLTSPKRRTPRIEYMSMKNARTLPKLSRDGSEMINVLEIILRLVALFHSRRILRILSSLMIVVEPPKLNTVSIETNMKTMDSKAIVKSKLFQLFKKYERPYATILIAASPAKIEMNRFLIASYTVSISSGCLYHYIVCRRAFSIIHIWMPISKFR
jgi:hypothetical protein